jgi:hypothetical protein
MLGRKCARQIWYGFRWWSTGRHTGRILRLFNRGHREEEHAVENLRKMGAIVEDRDPVTGAQTKFSTSWGLIGGERDGKVSNLEEFGLLGKGLLEIKTHGQKSFNQLEAKGLLMHKPEHFIQMQMYMGWSNLAWGLYYAVCKDNDALHLAVVPFRQTMFDQYMDRAEKIIEADTPPARLTEDPTWYECKFCDFKRHCHEGHAPDKNCRTCDNFELELVDAKHPLSEEWFKSEHNFHCKKWRAIIPVDVTREGCDAWLPIQAT